MKTKLSVKKFVNDSIEQGYSENQEHVLSTLVASVTDAFVDKLKKSNIQIDSKTEKLVVGIAMKYDSVFVGFRNMLFEVGLNEAILESNSNEKPWLFYEVSDKEKSAYYSKQIEASNKKLIGSLSDSFLEGTLLGGSNGAKA